MAGLAELLLGGEHKDRVIADCVQLVEGYVAHRGGFKGLGMRTGLAIIKAKRPDIVIRSTDWLLPEFLTALDPLYVRFTRSTVSGAGFRAFLLDHHDEANDALLHVADLRVDGTPNQFVKKTYARFRGDAEKEVEILLPALGEMIDRHLPTATRRSAGSRQ